MLRPAIPLLLAVMAVAGGVRAQAQDRYGPSRRAVAPALRTATAPAPLALRTLSWAGKVEPHQAAPAAPAPTYADAGPPRPTPTGRYPGLAAYRTPSAPASTPTVASAPAAALQSAPVSLPPAPIYAAPAPSPLPSRPYAGPYAPAPPRAGVGAASLPMATPTPRPTVVQAAAPAPRTDALPPPVAGRYGYVGPGRTATPQPSAPPIAAPAPAAAPVQTASTSPDASLPGPPRPPAYARAYVQPAAGATPAFDGARRYSVHRQYGLEPDPVPVPPQFFTPAADMSAPETEPAIARVGPAASKAAVNAARLQATGP